jgi:hypothetical protein
MNEYQKQLITHFIRDLIYDPSGTQSDSQEEVEDRAELAVMLKELRDGRAQVMRAPAMMKQTATSAAGVSRSLREGLNNNSLDSKAAEDLFGGYGPDLHGVGNLDY